MSEDKDTITIRLDRDLIRKSLESAFVDFGSSRSVLQRVIDGTADAFRARVSAIVIRSLEALGNDEQLRRDVFNAFRAGVIAGAQEAGRVAGKKAAARVQLEIEPLTPKVKP